MEKAKASKSTTEGEEGLSNEYEEILTTLPKVRGWNGMYLYKYRGFWIPSVAINGMMSFQQKFQARDTDIILVTSPKSGTTWLKALAFAIVNRARYTGPQSHPLLTSNPHELVPFFEFNLYARNEYLYPEDLPNPRIFATHTPYSLLPRCIVESGCRIVYLCRNPLDQFISLWFFLANHNPEIGDRVSLGEGLEKFCEGVDGYGPFWDHVLEYWNESLEKPHKLLFLKYEDLKEDIVSQSKKLADILGFPFSEEEEKQGMIEEISRLCSFDSLKNLDVNKTGNLSIQDKETEALFTVEKSSFFRKGEVGDWTNYLTPSMADRVGKLMEEKFTGSGLTFQMSS